MVQPEVERITAMPPLKILFVYYEPLASGQTTHVLSLVRGLDKTQFQIQVVLPDLLQELTPQFEAAGARVLALPMRRLMWKPAAVSGLLRVIRSERPDIVHIHSQEAGMVARPFAWLAGAKNIFYTPQTIDIRRKRWQGLVTLAERLLAHLTRQIISVNEADRQRMIQWGIRDSKIATIYNGVDLDEVVAGQASAGLFPPGALLVIQLGRLSEQKNPLAFVEGAEHVLRIIPKARFVFIGEGDMRAVITERIDTLNLQDKIKLLGNIPQAAHWLGMADVVTLTSLWEGTPYSLIEAMAWSRPVVATCVNGCREVVVDGQTGFLVSPDQPKAWAERVITLLQDPDLRARLGSEGRKRAERMFSIQAMITSMAELYQASQK